MMKTIYYDITEIYRLDRETGIQRVIKSIYFNIIERFSNLYSIVLIVWNEENNNYSQVNNFQDNEIISLNFIPNKGDVFLCADLNYKITNENINLLCNLKLEGIKIFFIVHDLIPVMHPEFFLKDKWFENDNFLDKFNFWLNNIIKISTGIITVSDSTMLDLEKYILEKGLIRPFLDSNHLGSDLHEKHTTPQIIQKDTIDFLMVGTIEPRKNHEKVVKAFEELFSTFINVRLIIIGKEGWGVDFLVNHIENSSYNNKQLLWYKELNDEQLVNYYKNSDCLIAMSEYEGFGLPLIEAGSFDLSIIANDIPVFREVCGNNANYYSNQDLSLFLQTWIKNFEKRKHIKSNDMKVNSWYESTRILLDKIENIIKKEETK